MKTSNNTSVTINTTSIEEFAEKIVEKLRSDNLNAEIGIRKVQKNNGLVLTGLTIRCEEENITPTLYLDNFYENAEGEVSDELISHIKKVYENSRINGIDVRWFQDYDLVKPNLRMRLINKVANEEILKDTPYLEYGDLAVIFEVKVDLPTTGRAGAVVKDIHMGTWGATVEELFSAAVENQRSEFVITPMWKVLVELMGSGAGTMPEEALEEIKADNTLSVLSNEDKMYGAVGLVFTDMLTEYAEEIGDNLWIIPSSLHEVLISPSSRMPEEAVTQMIREVNDTQLATEEVLSDHVYFFDRETSTLCLTSNGPEMPKLI